MIKTRPEDPLDKGLKCLMEAFETFQKKPGVIPETLEINLSFRDTDLTMSVEFIDVIGGLYSKTVRVTF